MAVSHSQKKQGKTPMHVMADSVVAQHGYKDMEDYAAQKKKRKSSGGSGVLTPQATGKKGTLG